MYILENIESEEDFLRLIEVEKKDKDYFKESQIQNMIIQFLKNNNLKYHASFNGIKVSSLGQMRFMKSQGLTSGHPDLTIYKRVKEHELLFLELKTVKNKLSENQKKYIRALIEDGYIASVAYGYYDAVYKIKKYLEGEAVIVSMRELGIKTEGLTKRILENREA